MSSTAAAGGTEDSTSTTSTADVTGTSVITQNSSDFWESIAENLRSIIGAGDDKTGERSVVVNSQSGVVVVRAMPNELRNVAEYLAKTENTVTRQVVLEAKIVEVELSDAYQAGINWAAVLTQGNRQYFLGQSTPRGGFDGDLLAPPNVQVPVGPGNPGQRLPHQCTRRRVHAGRRLRATSTPSSSCSACRAARACCPARASRRSTTRRPSSRPARTSSSSPACRATRPRANRPRPAVDVELTPFFSGVALDVTPQINDQGEVLMHIHPTVSDVTDQQKELSVRGQTDSLPLALSQIRESDSIVRARSGQVIVIGGLMRQTRKDQDYKTPFLGDIPGLGRLFRSERNQTSTTELVILLRPLVVNDGDWPQLVKESNDRVDELARKGKLQ